MLRWPIGHTGINGGAILGPGAPAPALRGSEIDKSSYDTTLKKKDNCLVIFLFSVFCTFYIPFVEVNNQSKKFNMNLTKNSEKIKLIPKQKFKKNNPLPTV